MTTLDTLDDDDVPDYCPDPHCCLFEGHPGDHTKALSHRSQGVDIDAWNAAVKHNAKLKRDYEWDYGICPTRFHGAELGQLDLSRSVTNKINDWVKATTEVWKDPGDALILLGDVGTGKTHAAVAAGYELHMAGRTVAFTTSSQMFRMLRPEGGHTVDHYVKPDILVIDDIGTEKRSEWTEEQLFAIVDERWAACHPLIVTSNLTPDELRQALGPRVYDRVRDGATALHLSGPSRRKPSTTSLRQVQ